MKVAALYVMKGGVYYGLPNVEPWGEAEDARKYAGPWPVIVHPPCARWGSYWSGGPAWVASRRPRKKMGDDGGCFAAALVAVEKWGGVLEHPCNSHAWEAFQIVRPPRGGGWVRAGLFHPGMTCCVEQGHYGHRARKATWLYAVLPTYPELRWGKAEGKMPWDGNSFHSADERRRAVRTGACQRLSHRERSATPVEFRDLLLGMVLERETEPEIDQNIS